MKVLNLTIRVFCFGALVFGAFAQLLAQDVDPRLYSGLVWRNIGPFRGGRVAAVTGAVGEPGVFYMGLPLGGIWKSTSAGTTWFPVFDSVKDVSSVGSVEVAPSDPNIVYAGTGDLITGGGINEGNGVYKSTDAGKTWTHLGLDNTKQIPSILVDPHNPDIVMVAAQGNIRQKSNDRGLYRSTDGGKTWTKTLFVNDETGIQKIAWAYDNPSVVFATTVRHYNAPGQRGFGGFGGGGAGGDTGAHLFKSTDEGVTWKEIESDTLPETLAGRTCVAVAMHTNSQRVFLVGNFGLYRSDDGGEDWKRMDSADRRVANGQGGYNCGVYVNTKNPDTVYVINTSSYISTDGGNTFTGFKGAPGGDDPQQMWLDPTDGNRIFLGLDQGGTVTLDGGKNWSSWYNQATAQCYHISVDNQFPYWVYGTQQDTASVSTSSRGNLGEITPLDWSPHPGFEFGFIVPDPLNPKISYAGGPTSSIIKTTKPSGQWIDVSPSTDASAGLRAGRDQPIVFSESNPRELFMGYQYLMATTDGGLHWHKLSPDFSVVPGAKPATPRAPAAPGATSAKPASPATAAPRGTSNSAVNDDGDDDDGPEDSDDEANRENMEGDAQTRFGGASISSITSSSVADGTIWIGTNSGLIKVTKDNGRTWEDASIHYLATPDRANVVCLDASHQDPATAYAAIDMRGASDLNPYFFRTHDYGKTWTKIVTGLPTDLPSGDFARVIRADTEKAGLLFAGTESFMYVSFNDGETWQSLALNQPNTSYRDAVIHGNDLIVGTYGRSFWVLDDISPLREITAGIANEPAHLFKPGDAIRVRRNVGDDTPFPPEVPHAENPPLGAVIYYYLGAAPQGTVTLEVSDSSGRVIRHMSSAPIAPLKELPPNPDYWTEIPKSMPTEVGTNRINWNLRYDDPPAFSHTWEINANPGETPASPEGPLVPPGVYTLKLTVDGKSYTQTVKVVNDPRSPASTNDIRAQYALQENLYDCIQAAWDRYHQVTDMRAAVADILKQTKDDDVTKAGTAFDAKLAAIGGTAAFGRGFGGGGGRGGARPTASFALYNRSMISLLETLDPGDMTPTAAQSKQVATSCSEMKALEQKWIEFNQKDLADFNAVLAKHSLMPISSVK